MHSLGLRCCQLRRPAASSAEGRERPLLCLLSCLYLACGLCDVPDRSRVVNKSWIERNQTLAITTWIRSMSNGKRVLIKRRYVLG